MNGTGVFRIAADAAFGFSAPYFETVTATGINDAGQIVGTFDGIESGGVVFNGSFLMDQDGTFHALDLSNGTYANAISNNGYILGTYFNGIGVEPIIMNSTGQIIETISDDPAADGYGPATLTSINDAGDIVGFYDPSYHAFLLNAFSGQIQRLPSPQYCSVGGINDQGHIVGACENYAPARPSNVYGDIGFELTPVPEPGAFWSSLGAILLAIALIWYRRTAPSLGSRRKASQIEHSH